MTQLGSKFFKNLSRLLSSIHFSVRVGPQSRLKFRMKSKIIPVLLTCLIIIFLQFILCTSRNSSWNIFHQVKNRYQSSVFTTAKPSQHAHHHNTKFLVRDWSVWLGWNNSRFIIEMALLIAKLLDRTLVLPAFTYATACEYNDHECADLAPMLVTDNPLDLNRISNRTWYPDPDNGKNFLMPRLPTQNNKGWVLPIDKMLDVDHLISTWGNAIRFEDFLQITNPDVHSIGMSSGKWNPNYNRNMSYKKVTPEVFTNLSITMVDRLPKSITPLVGGESRSKQSSSSLMAQCTLKNLEENASKIPQMRGGTLNQELKESHETREVKYWDPFLEEGAEIYGILSQTDNVLLESCLALKGLRSFYAYNGLSLWMKAPYIPIKVIRKLKNTVGWWDDLHKFDQQVLHLEGELHDLRPPGAMVWSSLEGRKQYERLAQNVMRPPKLYHSIASRLELRMRERCGGRSWVGAHMRRGDFVKYHFQDEDITRHWSMIEHNTRAGAQILQKQPDLLKASHQQLGTSLEPPRLDDPIYISTDIREEDEIAYLRTKNIIVLQDLLDDADKLELGFSAKFMDTLSILEQCLLMRAGFFYGDAHSSVDGWILNGRESYGISQTLTRIQVLH